MKEKLKILSNEIEILRHEIFAKDRDLAKKKQDNTAKYAARDSLKNEANKLMVHYRERRGIRYVMPRSNQSTSFPYRDTQCSH